MITLILAILIFINDIWLHIFALILLTILVISFTLLLILFNEEKKNHEIFNKEMKLLQEEIKTEIELEHFVKLKNIVSIIKNEKEQLIKEYEICNKKNKEIAKKIIDNSQLITQKLTNIAAIKVNIDEIKPITMEKLIEIKKINLSNNKLDFSLLEEKIMGFSEHINLLNETITDILEFFEDTIKKIIKENSYFDNLSMIFDDLKLIYLNLQLEAIKKGEEYNEFRVIGDEIKELYQSGNELIENLKNNIIKVENFDIPFNKIKTMKLNIDTLIEKHNNLITSYEELKEQYKVLIEYEVQNKKTMENIYNNYDNLISQYNKHIEEQRDVYEHFKSISIKINDIISEIYVFGELLSNLRDFIGG